MYRLIQKVYHALPAGMRTSLAKVAATADSWLNPALRAKRWWLYSHYSRFGSHQRGNIFLACARFAHINRPITGYYFEFGSHEGNTMRLAWKHFRHLFQWTFVAFDSFEGLPEVTDRDKIDIFKKGRLATAEDEFVRVVTAAGMPRERLRTVKGFYDATLTPALRDELLPGKAAVVYVDCDLYASTVPVLEFVKGLLQVGTIIVFDDWNCYHADPNKGGRLAWAEFRERNPVFDFEDFYSTSEAKAWVFVGPAERTRDSSVC